MFANENEVALAEKIKIDKLRGMYDELTAKNNVPSGLASMLVKEFAIANNYSAGVKNAVSSFASATPGATK